MSNHLVIISCLFQSYAIWVCLFYFLLRAVLSFHRMTIRLSSRVTEKEIYILLTFLRALLYHAPLDLSRYFAGVNQSLDVAFCDLGPLPAPAARLRGVSPGS